MKLKFLKDERGMIAILFTLILPIIAGFTAFAVDIGYIVVQRQKMQDAVDLAALSAAQSLTVNHGQVVSTAIDIAKKNEVKSSELTIVHPYKSDNNKVELTATKTVPLFFAPIIGINNTTITTRAVAGIVYNTQVVTQYAALDYAIFNASSSQTLTIRGNDMRVNGNVHSNANLRIMGNNHVINGNVTAVSGVQKFNTTVNGTVDGSAPYVPIPAINFDEYASKATKVFNSSVTLQDMQIEGIWLVNGDVTINGGRVFGRGILLATGNVKITGNGLGYNSSDALLAIYSKGSIEIASTGTEIKGVLYAPNGQIKINGSGNTVTGALIADEVIWAGNDISVHANYDVRVPQSFTVQKNVISLLE